MIPLPRPWLLAGAMLVGTAVGMLAAIAATVLITTPVRPDVAVVLVIGIPSALGLLTILVSTARWVTALGAFVLAIGPAWLGVLVAIQAVSSA